jgi:hypothetical protein
MQKCNKTRGLCWLGETPLEWGSTLQLYILLGASELWCNSLKNKKTCKCKQKEGVQLPEKHPPPPPPIPKQVDKTKLEGFTQTVALVLQGL